MTIFEFFKLLNSNLLIYIFSLLFSLFLFYKVMKITSSSWLNPIRFNILTFSIGFSVFFFLFFLNHISLQTFIYIVLSTLIFWLTFANIFKNKQRLVTVKFSNEPIFAKYLFSFSYILYIILTLISYKLLGIPIFNKNSRLATYTGSGLGIIARILPVLYTYSLFYIIHLFFSHKDSFRRIMYLILLIPLIVIGVLSGSRSSFIGIIFIFWGYKTFYVHKEPKIRDFKWLLIIFILISLLTFTIQSFGNFKFVGLMFLQRIVACGDIYWESLVKETWKSVVVNRPLEYTFMGFLGPLHILNPANAEVPIGFQLTNIIYPSIAGKSTGPVALFPIFGLVCYGYIGGCIFSFMQALFASILYRIVFVKSNSIIVSSMSFFAFNSFQYLFGDISSSLGLCLDLLISYIFIAFLLLIIAMLLYFRNNYSLRKYNNLVSEEYQV